MSSIRRYTGWFILGSIALCAAQVHFGELNHDEGWYLYAARMVSEGQWPYRDFAFTQAPLLPFVYALFQPLVESGGVAAGRICTALLGLLTTWVAARFAAGLVKEKEARPLTAALVWILLGWNVYHTYFTTVVKTYSLCSLILVIGLLLLQQAGSTRSYIRAFLAGVLLIGAAGTRLSAGAAMPVALAGLWFMEGGRWRTALPPFVLGAFLSGLLLFVLPFALYREPFLFCLVEYHAGRSAGDMIQAISLKLGFLSRVVQGYTVPVLLAAAIAVERFFARSSVRGHSFITLVWWACAAITALHLTAPFPYDDYQVIAMPLFCAATAATIGPRVAASAWAARTGPALPILLVLIGALTALASPVLQGWKVQGRDRIWWIFKEKTDLQELRETGRLLKKSMGSEEVLLTADLYLAVEAGKKVPRGLEMGPFSFYPSWPGARASAVHVLDREGLDRLIADPSLRFAALSGYGFTIDSPSVTPVDPELRASIETGIDRNFTIRDRVPGFGQGSTELIILERRQETSR